MSDSINFINPGYFFRQIIDLFTGGNVDIAQVPLLGNLVHFLDSLRFPLLIISALFIASTVYSVRKLEAIRHKEHELLYAGHEHDEHATGSEEVEENERWKKVVSDINSDNPADWRMAIVEADILLDDLLQKVGYHGDSLGERLKSVARGDFASLDDAWEAHKIRNQIAHQGSDYVLTEREARRVIGLYESVFREFKYI